LQASVLRVQHINQLTSLQATFNLVVQVDLLCFAYSAGSSLSSHFVFTTNLAQSQNVRGKISVLNIRNQSIKLAPGRELLLQQLSDTHFADRYREGFHMNLVGKLLGLASVLDWMVRQLDQSHLRMVTVRWENRCLVD